MQRLLDYLSNKIGVPVRFEYKQKGNRDVDSVAFCWFKPDKEEFIVDWEKREIYRNERH